MSSCPFHAAAYTGHCPLSEGVTSCSHSEGGGFTILGGAFRRLIVDGIAFAASSTSGDIEAAICSNRKFAPSGFPFSEARSSGVLS